MWVDLIEQMKLCLVEPMRLDQNDFSRNSDVMLFSNNDVILQSEGGGGQKRPKNCGRT